jgi:hypothetical protein
MLIRLSGRPAGASGGMASRAPKTGEVIERFFALLERLAPAQSLEIKSSEGRARRKAAKPKTSRASAGSKQKVRP